jgi:hypothetical protein
MLPGLFACVTWIIREDIIGMDHREMVYKGVDWVYLDRDRGQ